MHLFAISSTRLAYQDAGETRMTSIIQVSLHLQNSLCPRFAFSYIGSITARHSSIGRQPNFAAWYREWNYVTSTERATCIHLGCHHIGHRPTIHILVYYNPVRVSARMNEQTKWGETVTVKRTNCNRAINNPYIEITRTA